MAMPSFMEPIVIDTEEKAERFVKALEESYQDSLREKENPVQKDYTITVLRTREEIKEFMERRKKMHDK